MKRYVNIFLLLICVLAMVRVFMVICFDKSVYHEESRKITGKVINIQKGNDKVTVDVKSGKVYRLTFYDDFRYELGDVIKVGGVVVTPDNNTVFNLFNYRKYLLSKGIRRVMKPDSIKLVSRNKSVFYGLKNLMVKRANRLASRSYVKAFVLGDLSGLEAEVKEDYQVVGISHLFALSGMHVNFLLAILNKLFKKSKYKNAIFFTFLIIFIFLTNFTPSLIRCTLFLFLNHVNKVLKLKIRSSRVLILTTFTLLLYNPYLVFNVGFLFSVIITFYLIIASDWKKQKKGYLKKIFFTSTISFLASAPILASYFFKINFLTPVYNVIFIPLISLIIFPLSIICFIIPLFDNILLFSASFLELTTNLLSNIKWLTFAISKPSLIIILTYYLILYLSLKRSYRYLVIYMVILLININGRLLIFNPELIFLDVGQGDGAVVILPGGKAVMIDTGGKVYGNYPLAKKTIIPYLNSRGISQVESLILTHGDYDHMGEAINLIENFKAENVIFNCGPYNDLEIELIEVLEKKNIKYYSCIKELNIDKYKLHFLNTGIYDNENDNSSVIYFNYNNYKFLFMGDAGVEKEKDILGKYNLKEIDFLKVGHHGSNTSSSEEFINSINPKYSLISVGKNNRYGHPKESVLDTLSNSKIYRTGLDGSIEIKLNKSGYKIRTCPP